MLETQSLAQCEHAKFQNVFNYIRLAQTSIPFNHKRAIMAIQRYYELRNMKTLL